jgi:hypothetical protein
MEQMGGERSEPRMKGESEVRNRKEKARGIGGPLTP